MDYPVIHEKIFSHLANSFANYSLFQRLIDDCEKIDMTMISDQKVKELHALCSFIKGEASERTMTTLIEMRDLCGGHGYSIYSQFPRFIRDHVISTTWEGSNGVLIQ